MVMEWIDNVTFVLSLPFKILCLCTKSRVSKQVRHYYVSRMKGCVINFFIPVQGKVFISFNLEQHCVILSTVFKDLSRRSNFDVSEVFKFDLLKVRKRKSQTLIVFPCRENLSLDSFLN